MQSAAIKDQRSILSKINDESPFVGTKANPGYMSMTIAKAAKNRKKTIIGDHHKWNASPKLENPDGPIKPLPPMNKYRAKMDAKKHVAELLAKIKANQEESLGLFESYVPGPRDEQQLERVGTFGWLYKDNNIYSSLPPMDNEEEYERLYIIDEDVPLGEGSSGHVFQGWRRSDNKGVAIKKVKKSDVFHWGNVNGQRYPIEYCHLRMLNGCSRIANLLHAYEIKDEFILVLETMDLCCDLLHHVLGKEKYLEENHSRMIFRQLVEAVGHCHNSGIFHRDIKLNNILIDINGKNVKLVDFDMSALACYSPFMETPGTCGYRSPEMYDRSIRYEGSPAAVYSMGVLLYDMIFFAFGWDPFDDQLPMPKVSLNCLDLISKMTASRPEDRLPFDKILDHPWMQS
jgi:hypothetical protein